MNESATSPALRACDARGYRMCRRSDVLRRRPLQGCWRTQLKASAVNPVLEPGTNSTLRITLENAGLIQELIPNKAGDAAEISSEASEELHSVDAVNITAKLSGNGPVVVTSGPYSLGSLPTGGVAQLDFNVTTGKGADGWYSLLLETEYEHQMDVKVSNGSSSSLYRPSNSSQKISILVQGPDRSLKVEGVVSDLYPGANGTILAVIKNNGLDVARNCTARLMAVPPFRSSSERYGLGDLQPGQAVVARLVQQWMAMPQSGSTGWPAR